MLSFIECRLLGVEDDSVTSYFTSSQKLSITKVTELRNNLGGVRRLW